MPDELQLQFQTMCHDADAWLWNVAAKMHAHDCTKRRPRPLQSLRRFAECENDPAHAQYANEPHKHEKSASSHEIDMPIWLGVGCHDYPSRRRNTGIITVLAAVNDRDPKLDNQTKTTRLRTGLPPFVDVHSAKRLAGL